MANVSLKSIEHRPSVELPVGFCRNNIDWIVRRLVVSDMPSNRLYCRDSQWYRLHSTYDLMSYRGLNNTLRLKSVASVLSEIRVSDN